MTDLARCTTCNHGEQFLVILPAVLLVLACFVLEGLRRLARRHQRQFEWWFSTLCILYYHCLSLSLVASLDVNWPHTLLALGRLLSLQNLISLPSLQCVVPDGLFEVAGYDLDFLPSVITSALKFSLVVIALFISSCLIKCNSGKDRDRWVKLLSGLFILVFLSIWCILDNWGMLWIWGNSMFQDTASVDVFSYVRTTELSDGEVLYAALIAVSILPGVIFLSLLGAAVYLRFHVNAYARGVDSGHSRWLPLHMLESRLVFFVHRFATHAPKWQFALCESSSSNAL